MKKQLLALSLVPFILSGCGLFSSNNYYQNDGPPSLIEGSVPQSATPKVQTFNKFANRPYTVMGTRYVPETRDVAIKQVGMASWYGKQFHGKKTSIGETYDMYLATAAHTTMPLPSYAKVTNLENGKSIIVRVNDRGPFLKDRVIDLSYGAAKALGYVNKGTAKVEVRRITNTEIASGKWQNSSVTIQESTNNSTNASSMQVSTYPNNQGWGAQVASFSSEVNARQFLAHTQASLSSKLSNIPIRLVNDKGLYRVIVGEGLTDNQARSLATKLKDILGTNSFAIQK